MIGTSDVLWGGVLPGLVAAATLAAVWWSTGKAASAWRAAIVLGFVVGHWALDARTIGAVGAIAKSYQPTEARDWLPLLLLLATIPDAIACVSKIGPTLGWVLRTALCLVLPWRLLYGSSYLPVSLGSDFDFDFGGWSTNEASAWIGGLAVALLVGWQFARSGEPRGEQRPGVVLRSLLATVVALGGAVTMALSDSLTLGQLFGVLTAALAGGGLMSVILSTERSPAAAAGPVMIAFGSLLIAGHFYAELKLHNGALLLVAMVLAFGWLPLPASLSIRWQAVTRSVLCLTALAVAVTLAGLDFAATQAESTDEVNPYEMYSIAKESP